MTATMTVTCADLIQRGYHGDCCKACHESIDAGVRLDPFPLLCCAGAGWLESHPLPTDLRSHEPPRNSGEGTAVNGPMPLAGGDDANAPA